PGTAVDWLGDRPGIAEARILTDDTGPWSSSGLVRGELEPGLDDAAISDLVTEVQEYADETGSVGFRLGIDGLDFAVPGEGSAPIGLWRGMRAVAGLASGVVDAAGIRARTLRPDAVAAFDALAALDAGIR